MEPEQREARLENAYDDGSNFDDLQELYESFFSFDESFHATSPPRDRHEDSTQSSKLYSSSCLTTVYCTGSTVNLPVCSSTQFVE